jgi:hypothetical protein
MAATRVVKQKPTVVGEALALVAGDHQDAYGDAEESFGRIAALWAPVLDIDVTPQQVALCLMQLRVAQYVHGEQRGSLVEIVEYAALLGQLQGWD